MMKKSGQQVNVCRRVYYWLVGFFAITISALTHLAVLPFCDMTLLSTTQATAIVSGVLLSIFWLKEPLVPKYDLPALSLMIVGGISIVAFTNKEVSNFTID